MRRKGFPHADKMRVLEVFGHRCANTNGEVMGWPCPLRGTRLTVGTAQFDHRIELADGGADDIVNLQPLCACCHDQKSRDSVRQRALQKMDVAPLAPAPKRCSSLWRQDWEAFRNTPAWFPSTTWSEEYALFSAWCSACGKRPPSCGVFRTHYHQFQRAVEQCTEPMEVE